MYKKVLTDNNNNKILNIKFLFNKIKYAIEKSVNDEKGELSVISSNRYTLEVE